MALTKVVYTDNVTVIYAQNLNDIQDAIIALEQSGFLPLAGGTMTGAIAMGSNKITGLANGTADNDAVNLSQMNSAISTNTAYFRGSFATRAALLAVSWQTSNPAGANYVTNNDFAIVQDDESQNDECWRYVYVTGTGWTAQYKINETPLTQAQIDALNSGATSSNISSIADKIDNPTTKSEEDVLTYNGSAWVAKNPCPEITIATAGAVTQALDAGKLYHFTGALTSLTITLNAAGTGVIPQYHFDFDSGSTAPTVTLPGTVTMQGGTFSPEASKHYEVDILNGYGVYVAW